MEPVEPELERIFRKEDFKVEVKGVLVELEVGVGVVVEAGVEDLVALTDLEVDVVVVASVEEEEFLRLGGMLRERSECVSGGGFC